MLLLFSLLPTGSLWAPPLWAAPTPPLQGSRDAGTAALAHKGAPILLSTFFASQFVEPKMVFFQAFDLGGEFTTIHELFKAYF